MDANYGRIIVKSLYDFLARFLVKCWVFSCFLFWVFSAMIMCAGRNVPKFVQLNFQFNRNFQNVSRLEILVKRRQDLRQKHLREVDEKIKEVHPSLREKIQALNFEELLRKIF